VFGDTQKKSAKCKKTGFSPYLGAENTGKKRNMAVSGKNILTVGII